MHFHDHADSEYVQYVGFTDGHTKIEKIEVLLTIVANSALRWTTSERRKFSTYISVSKMKLSFCVSSFSVTWFQFQL